VRSFTLHYHRRHATGIYTATVNAFSDKDAREAITEYEWSRGFRVRRFVDEPDTERESED
jgi:hypothetical protein